MSSHNPYPEIVVVLGGGGARGFAHIGVLQVLMEAGVKISGIVGTSMGALIGSTFASGTDLYYLEKVVDAMAWENLVDLSLPSLGLIDGNKIKCLIDLLTKGKKFNELNINFWVVATDLLTGEEVIFKEGPLATAVRASISIPGIFNPVEHQGQVLVDGAVVAGVPVKVAKTMNGDITIAVNVGFDHTHHRITNVFDVLAKVMDIMSNRLDGLQMSLADVTIVPELGGTGVLHFHKAQECIEIGREAAKKVLPKILELIDKFSVKQESTDQMMKFDEINNKSVIN